MSEPRITIQDICAAGHCVGGARDWLRRHGFEWRQFLRDGATEADLLATGDDLARRVIDHKHKNETTDG